MPERFIIGAMSGTSADGVDAALVRVQGTGLSMTATLVQHCHRHYADEVRSSLFAIRSSGTADLAALAKLGRQITLTYAQTVRDVLLESGISANQIAAIAAHGQTFFHDPPLTIQWFDPALLAWETHLAVVSDFRRADCAAGGQGAPLVPFADFILFRHATKNRVLLNIGGIANLTYLRAGGSIEDVLAFDIGPGNCISDWICRTFDPSGVGWDADGQAALQGRVISGVADQYLLDPYFALAAPKSTDTAAMLRPFQTAGGGAHATQDLLATAAYLTASTISQAIRLLPAARPLELIVSGGGVRNQAIMRQLRSMLDSDISIQSADRFAIPSDAKEAVAFALLGAATLDGFPSNVPSVTGASRCVVLGSITPRP